ncbi:MAG: hypothetical protein ACLTJ9_09655 [Eggerthella lenta]
MRNAERTASGRNAGGEPSRPAVARDRLIDARNLVAVCALSLSTFVQNGYVYLPSTRSCRGSRCAGFVRRGVRVVGVRGAPQRLAAAGAGRDGARWRRSRRMRAVDARRAERLRVGARRSGWRCCRGRSWAVIVAGLSLTRLRPRGVLVTMAGGVCLSYAVYLVLDRCWPPRAGRYALLPAVALAAVAGPARLRDAPPAPLPASWR